ncbi:hypothetical protein T492DRAFT_291825 [Pavlovales sp. CCMP2436]|nr:hypothetical protein T492DRAFT_291825 [Pavlovales sp. CCMP2436]
MAEQIEAYAFRALVAHLQERPQVQNIELMNLAGFCRNCLAKWFLRGAEELGSPLAGGYEDASARVYGMSTAEWKAKHQQKASAEQMALFEGSKQLHAEHGPSRPPVPPPLSDVCCSVATEVQLTGPGAPLAPSDFTITLGVLTASDRASAGLYADESGPEVVRVLEAFGQATGGWKVEVRQTAIVPDERAQISALLEKWSSPAPDGRPACALILTTGGTGCAPRDVTPEATRDVTEKLLPGMF